MDRTQLRKFASSINFYWVAVLALTGYGAALRFYGIDRQSLWSDELFAVMASYQSHFRDIWPLLLSDSHPPGYVSFMYWTLQWTGYSDTAIRLHAFIFGVCWIPLTYWLGRRWLSPQVGLLAAILVTGSYPAIYYSQEARAYSMLVTFALLNLICFLEILLSDRPAKKFIWGFIGSATLLLYLHYSGFVWLAAEALITLPAFFIRKPSTKNFILYLKIFAIPLILFSPWLGILYDHMINVRQEWAVSAVPDINALRESLRRLLGPAQDVFIIKLILLGASVILATRSIILKKNTAEGLFIIILFLLIILPIVAFYIKSNIGTPIFKKRYFLYIQPLCTIAIAFALNAGLNLVSDKFKTILFPVSAIALLYGLVSHTIESGIYTRNTKDPIRDIAQIIKRDTNRNPDGIYTILSTAEWMEHYLIQYGLKLDKSWIDRRYYTPNAVASVKQYLDKHPEIKYFYYVYLEEDPEHSASASLQKKYKVLLERTRKNEAGKIKLLKFSATEAAPAGQPENAKTNDIINAVEWVIQHAKKHTGRYTTLITHDYMEYYLEAYQIQFDVNWQGRYYTTINAMDNLTNYIKIHPEIEIIYYLPRNEPSLIQQVSVINARYPLIGQHNTGKIQAYAFNVKVKK